MIDYEEASGAFAWASRNPFALTDRRHLPLLVGPRRLSLPRTSDCLLARTPPRDSALPIEAMDLAIG
jgi:hypothetical protein